MSRHAGRAGRAHTRSASTDRWCPTSAILLPVDKLGHLAMTDRNEEQLRMASRRIGGEVMPTPERP